MLESLSIRDLAVVGRVDLEFAPGLTVVTGETGAGKSILVDALTLVAGGRGDSALVRDGSERTEITAQFALGNLPEVGAWLGSQELDEDGLCSLRRTLRTEGSSRAHINGRPVGLAQLRELSEQLVEIHGQHEHQALLSRSHQLLLLDQYGRHDSALNAVRSACLEWRALVQQIETLQQQSPLDERELDRLAFELQELDAMELDPPRLVELESEHRRLAHAGELVDGIARASEWIEGDDADAALSLAHRAQQELSRLTSFDPELEQAQALIDSACSVLAEAATWLRRRRDGIELDGERLRDVESTLSQLHALARKHRVPSEGLLDVRERLRRQLHDSAGIGEQLTALVQARDAALSGYQRAAESLSALRRSAAAKLSAEISQQMHELGMAGGHFECSLEAQDGAPAVNGREQVEFLVSANAGMQARALRKVASGGELARISLAIKVATIALDDTPVLVFDEVDSGIGGAVAEIVGRKLRHLGQRRQVLCVTHLAQVAACAHQHLQVSKQLRDGRTESVVQALDRDGRIDELARMLGGVDITEATRAAAADLAERLGR